MSHRINGTMFTTNSRFIVHRLLIRRTMRTHNFISMTLSHMKSFLQHRLTRVVVLPNRQPRTTRLPRRPLRHLLTPTRIFKRRLTNLLNRMRRSHTKLRRQRQLATINQLIIGSYQSFIIQKSLRRFELRLIILTSISQIRIMLRTDLFRRGQSFITIQNNPMVRISRKILRGVSIIGCKRPTLTLNHPSYATRLTYEGE